MKVDDLLKELTNMLTESKGLPMTNKIVVDKEALANIIDDLKASLPSETRQAKAIVADRTKIISDAKKEAETIISVAEKKRSDMLENDELVRQSKQEAERIVAAAETSAKKIKNAANNYVDSLLERTENALLANFQDFQSKRKSVLQIQQKPRLESGNSDSDVDIDLD